MNHSPEPRGGGFGSRPYDPLYPSEIPDAPEVEGIYGLTQKKVDELRDILRRTRGREFTNDEGWEIAIRLISLARMLAEAPLDPPSRPPPTLPDGKSTSPPAPTQGKLPV